MAKLRLEGLNKVFGTAHVIHDVDLDITDGEFIAFVGPSGCGKSTLLRMIAGLEAITSGTLTIGGKDMTATDPAKRQIAMVFQSYALYPHMTVRGNLGFALRMHGQSKAQVAAVVDPLAAMLRLSDLMDRKPSQLSGGQRQRVAIGRALVRSPQVFLFDEPLSNLDAELRVQMRVELAQLHEQIGITTIYVTHDQVEAMTLADRIVVLREGRVEQVGTPLELYDHPANIFVAGFIGSPSMNFLEGKITEVRDRSASVSLDLGPRLDMRLCKPVDPGTPITLGIRPEHFVLGASEGAGTCAVTASHVELLGGDSFIHAHDGEGKIVIRDSMGRRARAGDRLAISLSPSACHLFDRRGSRISDSAGRLGTGDLRDIVAAAPDGQDAGAKGEQVQ